MTLASPNDSEKSPENIGISLPNSQQLAVSGLLFEMRPGMEEHDETPQSSATRASAGTAVRN